MTRIIENILIENFKGATIPIPFEFDASKKIVVIFGESGTGKSTIVDAIDFVCNQCFGSLDQKSVGSKKHELIASLNVNSDKIKVVLKGDGQVWQSGISKSKPVRIGAAQMFSIQVLRRNDILKFIEGQPKERYEKLRPFISLPRCEKVEGSLRKAIETDGTALSEAVRAIDQAESALIELWKAGGSSGKDAILWAREVTSKDVSLIKTTVDLINKILVVTKIIDGILKEIDTNKSDLSVSRECLIKLESQRDSLQASTNLTQLVTILKEAKQYFADIELPKTCPICQQVVDIANLKSEIDKRLTELTALSGILDEIKKQDINLKLQEKEIEGGQNNFIREVINLVELFNKLSLEEQKILGITSFGAVTSFPEAKQIYDSANSYITAINKRLLEFKSVELIDALKIHLRIIDEKKENARGIASRLEVLKKLLGIVEGSRKEYIDSILKAIAADIERLYLFLHPGEGLGGIQFVIDPDKVGSLDLNGSFQGVGNVLPQAYYSEAHLDTLGICIFFALSKYYHTEILVLDDVVTSSDEVHMTRYINMLHNESANFNQIILTTHYRPLRDRYRFNRAPVGLVQLFELKPWTLSRGVQHSRTTIWVDDLSHYIQPSQFDRQIVASKAGILLESLLDDLTLRFKCALPRQADPFYTLGDLLNGLPGKLRRSLKIEVWDKGNLINSISLLDILNRIDAIDWIRNQVGCHFNLSGASLSDKDVCDFGNLVVDFSRILICPECGSLPKNEKSGSYWECQCKKIRLHPLNMPA